MRQASPFWNSMRVSPGALALPLGGALVGAVAMGALHGTLGGMPWVLLSGGALAFGGPLVLLAAAACFWKRGPEHEDIRGLVLGAASFLLLLLPAHLVGGWLRDRKMETWRSEGSALAGWIEDHRESAGAYPHSLDGFPGFADLEWRPLLTYRSCEKEDTFTLSLRNPDSFLGWDGWEWNPATRSWDYVAD